MQRESALRYYLSVFHALVVDVYVALFECHNLAVPIGVAVALAVDVSVEAVRVSLGAPLAMLCLAVTFRFIHLVLHLAKPVFDVLANTDADEQQFGFQRKAVKPEKPRFMMCPLVSCGLAQLLAPHLRIRR